MTYDAEQFVPVYFVEDELAWSPAPLADDDASLAEIFYALAEDADDRRLRRVSARLAERLAAGDDIRAAAHAVGRDLPAHFRQALVGAANRGHLAGLLQGFAAHETTRKRLRRQLRSLLLYPAVIAALLLTVLTGISLIVLPQFEELYEDFDLELPTMTVMTLQAGKVIPWVALGVVAAIVAYFLGGLLPGGRRFVHWIRTGLPILGRVWLWSAQHEFASLMGALTQEQVRIEDALRTTAESLRDRNLARATRIVSRKCEEGNLLSKSLAESIHFDRALPALVGWGEANDALPAALHQAKVSYEKELDLHATFLRNILPPLLFMVVIATLFILTLSLFVPLVDLVNNLSG